MSDNNCKWRHFFWKCSQPILPDDPDSYCIFHSKNEAKNKKAFLEAVDARMKSAGIIWLNGCYFPRYFPEEYFRGGTFNSLIDFSGTTFSQNIYFFDTKFIRDVSFLGASFAKSVRFDGARFSGTVDFQLAIFGKEALFNEAFFLDQVSFKNAIFSKTASFFKTDFKDVDFGGTEFKGPANFDHTNFKGHTNFTWSEFWDWAFFFSNSKKTYERLEKPLEAELPDNIKEKISYDASRRLLICEGIMQSKGKKELLKLSKEDSYKQSVEKLFCGSQIATLGNPSKFHHTRFEGSVRFQEVDLSQCSFLHSNIDKVDFRYCTFGKEKV